MEGAFQFGAAGLQANQHGKFERRSREVNTAQLEHQGPSREVDLRQNDRRVQPNPFGDDQALRSKCGRVTLARHLACKRYDRGFALIGRG